MKDLFRFFIPVMKISNLYLCKRIFFFLKPFKELNFPSFKYDPCSKYIQRKKKNHLKCNLNIRLKNISRRVIPGVISPEIRFFKWTFLCYLLKIIPNSTLLNFFPYMCILKYSCRAHKTHKHSKIKKKIISFLNNDFTMKFQIC